MAKIQKLQRVTGINTLVLDEHIPTLDDRDENGRGDGKDTNKEKENIASHQNQLPAHVHRSVAEDVCPKDVKKAGSEKGDDYRGNKQLSTAFQHQQCNSKCFQIPPAKKEVYKNSFFVKTIKEWNQLEPQTVASPSVETFRARLQL